jgi:WD40 repeat protein
VAFSRDSEFVVSGSDDKTVKMWNVGETIRALKKGKLEGKHKSLEFAE